MAYQEDHSNMLNQLKPRWAKAYGGDYQFFEVCTLQPMAPEDADLQNYIWQKLTEKIEEYVVNIRRFGRSEIGKKA
jgi:hypothetical protein